MRVCFSEPFRKMEKPPSPPTKTPPPDAVRPILKRVADPWRLVIFDTETCPLVRPVVLRNGYSKPNVNNATIIQYAFGDINGDPIIPNTNLNPEVSNWTDLVGYTSYVENAWKVEPGELPVEAARLPTFEQSILASIYTLRTRVSRRLIIAAHNGHHWDFPVFRRQMLKAGYKFPDDMEIVTLETEYITRECVRRVNPYDRKWALGYAHERLFKRSIDEQHTAMGDIKALSRIIRYWATAYVNPKQMTETAIIATIFARNVGGLGRSELIGVAPSLTILFSAPGGPRELHVIQEEKKEPKKVTADDVIGATPEETAQRIKMLQPVAKRSLLTTLESVSKQ